MKKGDFFPLALIRGNKDYMVQYTGEYREPRAGEFFISGAIPEGYFCHMNISTKYHIAKRVKVREVRYFVVVDE